ncbi:MAG: helix-turn-helix transcriptional regulator [Acidimicrobiia bacterium]|nr:helix-turn-helix transcriptional regulator [Acidimicrobiia bacterium]
MRDRRSERRESTRSEILVAAWDLVRRDGLAALSLRELARRVGMQAPSLYSYFDSKNAIYDAMYAQGCLDYVAAEEQVPRTGDLLTDLKAGMRFFVGFCTEDPARYQLLFQRTIPGFEPSPESFAISVENLHEMAGRLAAMGMDHPNDLDLLTAVGTGITDQQISNDPGGDRWARLVDEAMEMVFEHVTRRRGGRAGRTRR